MLHRLRAVRKNDKGFTLTELLIVIVILGVLTGIVVFAVGAFSDRGNAAACKTDFKSVESAAEAYRAKTGGYPTGADPIGLLVTGQYLNSAPSTANGYTITLESATGKVTATGACTQTTPAKSPAP